MNRTRAGPVGEECKNIFVFVTKTGKKKDPGRPQHSRLKIGNTDMMSSNGEEEQS